jgi:ABC-type Fe3+ transport system permease subunit
VFTLVKPFTWAVWMALLVALLFFMPFLFLSIAYLEENNQDLGYLEKWKSFFNCLWFTFALLIGEKVSRDERLRNADALR